MSQRKLAQLMREGKIRPRLKKRTGDTEADSSSSSRTRGRRSRPLSQAMQEVPSAAEKKNPQSVYSRPDSWAAPGVVQRGIPQEDEAPPMKKRGPKRKPPHKRRSVTLGFTVSPEEDFMLRKYAFDQGQGFSEWARIVLFREMKKDIPPRT